MNMCKMIGHKWDDSDKFKQNCLNKNCLCTRFLIENKHPVIGEPKYDWKIHDINFKFHKK